MQTPPIVTPEEWEDSPEGYPQTPPYEWWNWHDAYDKAEQTSWDLSPPAGASSGVDPGMCHRSAPSTGSPGNTAEAEAVPRE